LETPAIIYHLAKFDLGKITEKDAVHWAILKLTPEEITQEDYFQPPFKNLKKEEALCRVLKVRWKRIASLVPSARQKEEGTAIWTDCLLLRGVCLLSLDYYPTDDGGVVLAKYNPEAKRGENPFQRIVVVGEEMAQWIPAAYQFRLKHAELFGKEFHEAKLVQLLQHENPMIAIQAAQRLAKEKRLLGKPLAAALEGPADFRRPVIIYIACLSQTIKTSKEGAEDLSGKPLQKGDVPLELQAAIRKADPKMLRWYVMALCGVCVNREKDIKMRLPLGALQLCQQRVKELPLDQDQRKELELLLECAEFDMNIYFPSQKSE